MNLYKKYFNLLGCLYIIPFLSCNEPSNVTVRTDLDILDFKGKVKKISEKFYSSKVTIESGQEHRKVITREDMPKQSLYFSQDKSFNIKGDYTLIETEVADAENTQEKYQYKDNEAIILKFKCNEIGICEDTIATTQRLFELTDWGDVSKETKRDLRYIVDKYSMFGVAYKSETTWDFKYDKNKQLIKETSITKKVANSSFYTSYIYFNDDSFKYEDSKLVEKISTQCNIQSREKKRDTSFYVALPTYYKYDTNGKKQEIIEYVKSFDSIKRITKKYDTNGDLIQQKTEERFRKDESDDAQLEDYTVLSNFEKYTQASIFPIKTILYKRNKTGEILEVTTVNEDGKINEIETRKYIYDKNEILTQTIKYIGGKIDEKIQYIYHDNGLIKYKDVYRYFEGHMPYQLPEPILLLNEGYTYDEKGNEIFRIEAPQTYSYQINSPITKMTYTIIERDIDYYE